MGAAVAIQVGYNNQSDTLFKGVVLLAPMLKIWTPNFILLWVLERLIGTF